MVRPRSKNRREHLARMHKIAMGLEVQPEFGPHSEKHPQPRGGIGRDCAPARDDLDIPGCFGYAVRRMSEAFMRTTTSSHGTKT
jgi:hypothetical protein